MRVTQIVSSLDEFGKSEVEKIDSSGNITFHTECNLDSVSEVEELVEYIDMLPSASLTITGSRRNALIIVKVDIEEFDHIPPYLEDDWKRDSDDRV